MRSKTLAEVIANTRTGAAFQDQLTEFADGFERSSDADRLASLSDEPEFAKDARLDALVGAIAEYLARQYELDHVPAWVSDSARRLGKPWHTSCLFIDWKRELLTDGMREFLTFSSPAEFASRNIFTEERPLRRARGPLGTQDTGKV